MCKAISYQSANNHAATIPDKETIQNSFTSSKVFERVIFVIPHWSKAQIFAVVMGDFSFFLFGYAVGTYGRIKVGKSRQFGTKSQLRNT